MPNPTCDNHNESGGVFCDVERGHSGQHRGTHGTTLKKYKWPISAEFMTIKHVQKLEGTPYYPFAMKGWIDIVEAGHGDPYRASFYDDSPAVIMLDGDRPVSIIVWYESRGSCHIAHAWTVPEYRRHGLNTKLYESLRELAKEKGRRRIGGGIVTTNVAMIEAARKQGRKEGFVYMEEELHA